MRRIAWLFAAIIIVAGVFSIKYFTMLLDSRNSAEVISRTYEYEQDFSNKKTLVSAADRIFIGEVLEEKERSTHNGQPAILYEVRVTQNIKGALLGGITVIRDGGYYKKDGQLFLLKYEDNPFLIKGQMYLFTVFQDKKGMFWSMPKYGAEEIHTEEQKYELMNEIKMILDN